MSVFPPVEATIDDYFASMPTDKYAGKHILPPSSSMGSLMTSSIASRALTPSETPSNPAEIIPVNFGIKYKPPKLGLQYHVVGAPQPQFVYEIPLGPFVTSEGIKAGFNDIDAVVDKLFEIHSDVIDQAHIARKQVFRLVQKVIAKLAPEFDKENSGGKNEGVKRLPGI